VNLKQLRDFVMLKGRAEGVIFEYTEKSLIDALINQALYDFSAHSNILKSVKTVSSASSYTAYALPSDCERIVKVCFNGEKINRANFLDFDSASRSVSASVGWS